MDKQATLLCSSNRLHQFITINDTKCIPVSPPLNWSARFDIRPYVTWMDHYSLIAMLEYHSSRQQFQFPPTTATSISTLLGVNYYYLLRYARIRILVLTGHGVVAIKLYLLINSWCNNDRPSSSIACANLLHFTPPICVLFYCTVVGTGQGLLFSTQIIELEDRRGR